MPLSKSISANRATFLTCGPTFCKDRCGRRERAGWPPVSDRLQHAVCWGAAKNALDHIEAAYENGFSPFSTGCQIIIADGLKGTDEVDVPVRGGEYIREAHIGRAVMDADIFIRCPTSKGTRARASAAPSRISAWAAVRAQERWTCIARVSRTWTKAFAGAAVCA